MVRSASQRYFASLFEASLAIIDRLPLTTEPVLMDAIVGVLQPVADIAAGTVGIVEPDDAEIGSTEPARGTDEPVGLNTVGLLLDRLSILAIKHWNLVHRRGDPAAAVALRNQPVEEIIEALAAARPGFSSLNSKLTVHDVRPDSESFSQSYRKLLVTNLLLWEAQEILYNHDIRTLAEAELRRYVMFFSTHNLLRNGYMEYCELFFWRRSREAGSPG